MRLLNPYFVHVSVSLGDFVLTSSMMSCW